jgi:hypothetical protein
MATGRFSHEVEIAIAPAKLFEFLCDLRNYLPLHPLIESIDDLPPIAALPRARHYRVVDKIPFGPFRLTTVYRAALEPISEHAVRGHAWQFPAIHLVTDYGLQSTERGTRLSEHARVEAPLPLLGFVTRQASRAHAETLRGMQALLERS